MFCLTWPVEGVTNLEIYILCNPFTYMNPHSMREETRYNVKKQHDNKHRLDLHLQDREGGQETQERGREFLRRSERIRG